jgi:hypothetical protein
MNTWKLVYKEPEYIHSGAKGFTTYQSECKAYRTGEGQSGAQLTVGDKVLLAFNNEVIAEGVIAHLNFWQNTVLGINNLHDVMPYKAPASINGQFSGIVLVEKGNQ